MPGVNDLKIPSVWLVRDSDGKRMKVNAVDYASDLGKKKYAGWRLVSEQRGDTPKETVKVQTAAGETRVSPGEAAAMNTGVAETPKFQEVVRKRGRPRKDATPNEQDR